MAEFAVFDGRSNEKHPPVIVDGRLPVPGGTVSYWLTPTS
jgi:hypothetical protein